MNGGSDGLTEMEEGLGQRLSSETAGSSENLMTRKAPALELLLDFGDEVSGHHLD